MSESAVERTARALDLIPYIVEHPGVSIEELSREFSTSESEISEILNIVFMCGLPGYTHLELIDLTTEGGEVSVMDAQNLDKPRRLSQVEVVSILLGLRNLRIQGTSESITSLIDSLEQKLMILLDDIRVVSSVDTLDAVETSSWKGAIQSSIVSQTSLEIEYISLTNEILSTRTINPIRMYAHSGQLYVEAHCIDIAQNRNFRLDRIQSVKPVGEFRAVKTGSGEPQEIVVEVIIPSSARLFLERNEGIVKSVEPLGDGIKIVFVVSSAPWLLRNLAAIDGAVEVLSPQSIVDEFKSLAARSLRNYKNEENEENLLK